MWNQDSSCDKTIWSRCMWNCYGLPDISTAEFSELCSMQPGNKWELNGNLWCLHLRASASKKRSKCAHCFMFMIWWRQTQWGNVLFEVIRGDATQGHSNILSIIALSGLCQNRDVCVCACVGVCLLVKMSWDQTADVMGDRMGLSNPGIHCSLENLLACLLLLQQHTVLYTCFFNSSKYFMLNIIATFLTHASPV